MAKSRTGPFLGACIKLDAPRRPTCVTNQDDVTVGERKFCSEFYIFLDRWVHLIQFLEYPPQRLLWGSGVSDSFVLGRRFFRTDGEILSCLMEYPPQRSLWGSGGSEFLQEVKDTSVPPLSAQGSSCLPPPVSFYSVCQVMAEWKRHVWVWAAFFFKSYGELPRAK